MIFMNMEEVKLIKIIVAENGMLMALLPNGDVKPILVDSDELQSYATLKVEMK